MIVAPSSSVPRLRLAALIWLAGMCGAVVVTITILPQLGAEVTLPAPLWLIGLAGSLQSGLLLALATWAGVALAPRVGFRAPVFEAAATRGLTLSALWSQLRPGILAGVPSGLILVMFMELSPPEIAQLTQRFDPPLLGRLLYGGITEEVFLRWGLMTVLTWLMWRLLLRRRETMYAAGAWLGIVTSSLLFGVGHLPVAHFLLGGFTANTLFWVIGVNTSFGLLFGWLYWRRGLESAMTAHAMTHLVHYLAGLVRHVA